MWQTKYASAIPKNLGLELNFWPCSKSYLLTGRPQSVVHCELVYIHPTDYGHPVRKSPSVHVRKSNLKTKFLGMAEAYFVCHIGPKFQISLIYAFIGCPQSVVQFMPHLTFWADLRELGSCCYNKNSLSESRKDVSGTRYFEDQIKALVHITYSKGVSKGRSCIYF